MNILSDAMSRQNCHLYLILCELTTYLVYWGFVSIRVFSLILEMIAGGSSLTVTIHLHRIWKIDRIDKSDYLWGCTGLMTILHQKIHYTVCFTYLRTIQNYGKFVTTCYNLGQFADMNNIIGEIFSNSL